MGDKDLFCLKLIVKPFFSIVFCCFYFSYFNLLYYASAWYCLYVLYWLFSSSWTFFFLALSIYFNKFVLFSSVVVVAESIMAICCFRRSIYEFSRFDLFWKFFVKSFRLSRRLYFFYNSVEWWIYRSYFSLTTPKWEEDATFV